MKPDVRSVLLALASKIKQKCVTVLLSSGIDSASVLFALRESGKTVTCVSFMMDGRLSTDFAGARSIARRFGCEFIPVFLPRDLAVLKRDMVRLAELGAKRKTDFECGWPMLYAYESAPTKVVASGMGADGHFCISKKGMIHFRDRIDEFRLGLYRSSTYAQAPIHRGIAKRLGKTVWTPYMTDEMRKQFLGTSWAQVNKPRQKEPILRAFPLEFIQIRIRPHANLQLGDSGIHEHFLTLLKSDWNKRKHKSVVGIFNEVSKGSLP